MKQSPASSPGRLPVSGLQRAEASDTVYPGAGWVCSTISCAAYEQHSISGFVWISILCQFCCLAFKAEFGKCDRKHILELGWVLASAFHVSRHPRVSGVTPCWQHGTRGWLCRNAGEHRAGEGSEARPADSDSDGQNHGHVSLHWKLQLARMAPVSAVASWL